MQSSSSSEGTETLGSSNLPQVPQSSVPAVSLTNRGKENWEMSVDEVLALQAQGPELDPSGPKELGVSVCTWYPSTGWQGTERAGSPGLAGQLV